MKKLCVASVMKKTEKCTQIMMSIVKSFLPVMFAVVKRVMDSGAGAMNGGAVGEPRMLATTQ